MLTDATESVTRNGRRIQSFPSLVFHSQTNLFARSYFIDLLNCKRRMLIITLSAYNRTPINDLVAAY